MELAGVTVGLKGFSQLKSLELSAINGTMELGSLDATRFPCLMEFGVRFASTKDLQKWFPPFIQAHPQIENLVLYTHSSGDLVPLSNQPRILPNLKRLTTNEPWFVGSLFPVGRFNFASRGRPLRAISFTGDDGQVTGYLEHMPSTVIDFTLVTVLPSFAIWKRTIMQAVRRCPNLRRLRLPMALHPQGSEWNSTSLVSL